MNTSKLSEAKLGVLYLYMEFVILFSGGITFSSFFFCDDDPFSFFPSFFSFWIFFVVLRVFSPPLLLPPRKIDPSLPAFSCQDVLGSASAPALTPQTLCL